MSAHSISEGFMKDGQRYDGLNERSSDWNPIQVTRECRLVWMKKHVVPEVDSTRLKLSRFKPTRQVIIKLTRSCYGMIGWNT
jgi:hypothetical protein